MFDSVQGGYIPICVVVAISAWFISGTASVSRRTLMTLLIPVVISFLWYVVPDFFRAVPERRDASWLSWGLVATMMWSVAAIPVSFIFVFGFCFIRKASQGINNDKSP